MAVEDDLTFQNRPYIRGQLLVGGDITNSSGELEVEYQPESLLNPPPGFLRHIRMPAARLRCKRSFCRREKVSVRCQVSVVSAWRVQIILLS